VESLTEINIEFFDSKEWEFSDEEKKTINTITIAAEKEIRVLLPQLSDSILLSVMTGHDVIPSTGEVGAAMAPGYVRWIVSPNWEMSVNEIAKASLRDTLFHEFHHLVRGWVLYGGNPMKSFMDAVISEGLATAFERDASGSDPDWGHYPADVENWVNEVLQLPLSAPYDEWMFRHPDGRIYIGYRAGTYIVDRAMKNSGLSAAELVLTPTEEILGMSGLK
jgi:uncharacterized protein YjaZ